jgi:hypothetical protein
MDGLINPWSAATDTLLQTLAQRDAAARLEEQKQRQMQLDVEERADREAMRSHQAAQLRSLDEDRDERRRLASETAAERTAAARDKKAMEDLEQSAIWNYQNAPDAESKAKARELLELQFKYRFQAPEKPATPFMHNVAPGATVLGPDGKPLYTAPDRPRAGSGDEPKPATPAQIRMATTSAVTSVERLKDDELPEGVSRDQLIKERRDQALADLGVDPAKYPMQPVVRLPPGVGAGTTNTRGPVDAAWQPIPQAPPKGTDINLPAEGPRGPGRGAGAGPGAGGPPKPVQDDAAVRAAAIAALEAGGKDANEANIALVMQRIRARQGGK